jgi:hypothetical protein
VTDEADLELLSTVVDLTDRRLTVPAEVAWRELRGSFPQGAEWIELRTSVLRLEREGLVRTDPDLNLEATPVGCDALRAGRP